MLVALALICGPTSDALSKARRIVSMNLCTDQLVMLLADRAHIASVSHLAQDPQSSALARDARDLRVNHGLAEEILPLRPDLVLAGAFTTRPTVFLLRKLGYQVVELPVASSLDDIRTNIRTIAAAIEEPERGEALIAEFDRSLVRSGDDPEKQAKATTRPLAALYWANGYTSGSGTLANAVVTSAGFRTLGVDLGLTGTGQLPLETLVMSDPDVLIRGRERDGQALANEVFRHPALQRAFAGKPNTSVPDHLWICGTPFVAEAIAQLSAVREKLRPGRQNEKVE